MSEIHERYLVDAGARPSSLPLFAHVGTVHRYITVGAS